MSKIVLAEEGVTPSAPSVGQVTIYFAGGVLYTLANGGSPVQYLATGVLTTQGDLLYRGAANPERLAIGTSGQLLRTSAGGIPEWWTATAAGVGAVAISLFSANGDMVYRNGAGTVVRLPIGTAGQVLRVSSGLLPEWAAPTVPWTAVVTSGLVTTTDATPTVVVTEAQQALAGGIFFEFVVTAVYRNLAAMYSWKIIADVTDDGAGTLTLRNAVVTPTDPGALVTIGLSIVGTNLVVTATGLALTTIDWNKSGSRTFFPQGP